MTSQQIMTSQQMSEAEYVAREFGVSSINNAFIAGVMFNPLNLARARLQLQHDLAPNTYRSLRHCLSRIAAEDGIGALWRYGVTMSAFREATYGGGQWGLYTPFKALLGVEDEDPSMVRKMGAGLLSGAVSAAFVTPVDRIMIKQFVESGRTHPATGLYSTGLYIGKPPSYTGTADILRQILRADGVKGLYRGWEPTVVRAALITMGLTVSYDTTKELAVKWGTMNEGTGLHVVASVVSGVTASVLCAPPDIVKSRMMAAPEIYTRGPFHCAAAIVRHEGMLGLYKGVFANISRLCPAVVVQMPIMEQLRRLAGLEYFGKQAVRE